MNYEQIEREYFSRKHKYFEARNRYNKLRRREACQMPKVPLSLVNDLLYLAEEYGCTQAMYEEFRERYGHLIKVEQ